MPTLTNYQTYRLQAYAVIFLPITGFITGATNALPIVITSQSHGLSTGDSVTITGALGNTAANGTWTIVVITVDTFLLNGRAGNGWWTSGGTWTSTSTTPTQFDITRVSLTFALNSIPFGSLSAALGRNIVTRSEERRVG